VLIPNQMMLARPCAVSTAATPLMVIYITKVNVHNWLSDSQRQL